MKKYFALILIFAAIPAIWGMEENINKQLMNASKKGDVEEVKRLLDQGSRSFLWIGKKKKQRDLINNSKDYLGERPLTAAIWRGKFDVVELLLERGADVNLPGINNQTPLMLVSQIAWNEPVSERYNLFISRNMAELLLRHKADVHAVDDLGRTALFSAAEKLNYWVMLELLNHGALIDFPDKEGRTPLLAVAESTHPNLDAIISIVYFLMRHNADPSILGGSFKASPLMWAANNGHKEICRDILTLVSHQDENEIRKNWNGIVFFQKAKEAEGFPFPKDIRNLLSNKLIKSLVDDRMKKAIFLMNQTNKDGLTASQIAAKKNHLELAKYLDPKNKESLNEIRKIIRDDVVYILKKGVN